MMNEGVTKMKTNMNELRNNYQNEMRAALKMEAQFLARNDTTKMMHDIDEKIAIEIENLEYWNNK
jgi:hypothetical protein